MRETTVQYIDVVERRSDSASGHRQCVLGTDIHFDKSAIERATFRALEDQDIDLLVVISSVAYVDRLISRRRGTRWWRSLSVQIPVYHVDVWERLAGKLSAILRLLTGDAWTFRFRSRERKQQWQEYLPSLSDNFEGATVIPYSGGLDSFAMLARLRHDEPSEKVLLVNARRTVSPSGTLTRPEDVATIGVPFLFHAPRHRDESYRTRTFTYFTLAALVWWKNSARRILIGESGLGCLGPALVPVGIEQPVRGSHPDFTEARSELLGQLWGTPPPFSFPHLWHTKAMVLADLRDFASLEGWVHTKSCSRNIRRQHPGARGSHCGLCTGCLFRRVSVHAGGLPAEDPETYFEDVLQNASLDEKLGKADREIATCAVLAMDELAGLAEGVEGRTPEIVELAASLHESVEATRTRLGRLIRKHREEWRGFLAQLPTGSWIRDLTFTGAA
jgi:hypothetical protein